LLARATARRDDALPLARRVTLGALAAAFPDIDFVTSYVSPLTYLYHHRGVTHSLLMLPLWAVLTGFLCALLFRDRARWRSYAMLTGAGIAIHILGDLITAFGTMIFAPFSDARVAWSTTFIIDLWFTGIIVAGLALSAAWRRSRAPAVLGLAVLCGYVGFQYVQQQRAIDFGRAHAGEIGWHDAVVTASPRPVSPYNWMVIVESGERYRYALVNLERTAPREDAEGFIARLDAAYRPLGDAAWVEASRFGRDEAARAFAIEAWSASGFAFYRWFAAYPALLRIDRGANESCAWFHDLRFLTPGRGALPFRYGSCRDAAGVWRRYRLVGEASREAVD
jgi:inner membrane protein